MHSCVRPPILEQRNDSRRLTIQRADIVGNFVSQNNPSISLALANGASVANASNITSASSNPITDFPQFDIYNPVQINLNQTGGTPIQYDVG